MSILSQFIAFERGHYADKGNNLFAFSLGQSLRYYEFITIIAARHREASQRMVQKIQESMEDTSTQSGGPMTDDQIRLMLECSQQATLVHLEIESFYLFAKVLLDKIALFLQDYFGPEHGISLRSHDKLTKSHKAYGKAKGLVYPDGLSQNLTFLKEHVCDYRDKQISHLQNPRTMKGTTWDGSGETRIAANQLYPNPSELGTQAESTKLPDLMAAIDRYLQQVVALVELNRGKTRFRFKEQKDIS